MTPGAGMPRRRPHLSTLDIVNSEQAAGGREVYPQVRKFATVLTQRKEVRFKKAPTRNRGLKKAAISYADHQPD